MELSILKSTIGGRPTLGLSGEIDLATIPALHNALVRLAHDNQGRVVVVDLDGVSVCDDAGLGVLLGGAGRIRETGGDLIVVCSDGRFRQRLARTGFDRAIQIEPSIVATAPR